MEKDRVKNSQTQFNQDPPMAIGSTLDQAVDYLDEKRMLKNADRIQELTKPIDLPKNSSKSSG